MYIRLIIFLIFISFGLSLNSQQLPLFTFYRDYHSVINPAVLHHEFFQYDQNAQVGLAFRRQWTAIEGSPTTALVHGHFVGQWNGNTQLITGGYLMHDRAGPVQHTGLYGRLGVVFSRDPYYGGVSGALTIGMNQLRLKVSDLVAQDITELPLDEIQNEWFPDIGVGIFGQARLGNDDNIYGGISVPQVFAFNSFLTGSDNKPALLRKAHYYATFGYVKYVSEYVFFEPSAWVKYTQTGDIHVDGNLRAQLAEEFWLGVGYSTTSDLHLEVGVVLGENIYSSNTYRIGYGLNENFGPLANIFGKTHEIFLSIGFSYK